MAHLQRHAGLHAHGRGGVRQEDAHGWIAAQWRQHTSRAGDPQLHIHQTILNKVRTERDGGMRTLDGRVLYQERGAASAIGTLVMENALTRDLGVAWVQRADGHGREIRGVPQALMDEFSTRARRDIAPNLRAEGGGLPGDVRPRPGRARALGDGPGGEPGEPRGRRRTPTRRSRCASGRSAPRRTQARRLRRWRRRYAARRRRKRGR